jgi:hypothetical protein
MASEARRRTQAVMHRREMVVNAGRQDGTALIFLSPNQIIDISSGSMVIIHIKKSYMTKLKFRLVIFQKHIKNRY